MSRQHLSASTGRRLANPLRITTWLNLSILLDGETTACAPRTAHDDKDSVDAMWQLCLQLDECREACILTVSSCRSPSRFTDIRRPRSANATRHCALKSQNYKQFWKNRDSEPVSLSPMAGQTSQVRPGRRGRLRRAIWREWPARRRTASTRRVSATMSLSLSP